MKDENMVSQSHFNMPEINMVSNPDPPSLPASYGKTSIFLMAVDPYSAHIIWEVEAGDMSRLNQKGCRPLIRLHDITENLSYAPMARASFEVEINIGDKKSYITLPKAGRTYSAELGFKNANGRFSPLARSNSAEAPRDTPATGFYPDSKSADHASRTSATTADDTTAAEVKAENFDQTVPPLENRIRFGGEAVDKYINAIEIIKNPPRQVSFLPHAHIDTEPYFPSVDYAGLHENPPREIPRHGQSFNLTESVERRFIAGISSR